MPKPTRLQFVLAFAALYIVWGSTYLAMRILVEVAPPFASASARFLIAGSVPFLWMRLRGERAPSLVEWRNAAVAGAGLFFGGNGLVMWTEQSVPSGLTALVLATTPVWFALFNWLRPDGVKPTRRGLIGITVGMLGAVMLVDPRHAISDAIPVLPMLGLMLACMSWVAGSLYSKHNPKHPSLWMSSAQNMICGGVALLILSAATGELPRVAQLHFSSTVLGALAYLVVFGSWIGFGSYAWLLEHATPAKLSTYAYVNPVIAMILGTWWLDEPFTARTALAASVILLAVAIVQGVRLPSFRARA